MNDFDGIAKSLAKMQGHTVSVRIQGTSLNALLSEVSLSSHDMAIKVVFENSDPKAFYNFYKLLRRNVGSLVATSISGVQWESILTGTTKFPAQFKPEAYLNNKFTLTFKPKVEKSASAPSAMISIPVPNSVQKEWGFGTDLHLTLCVIPTITESQVETIAWIVNSITSQMAPMKIELVGNSIFGGWRVATVKASPELRALRTRIVNEVLRKFPNLVNTWQYPVWHPHVTIGRHSSLPPKLHTDTIFTANTVEVNIRNGVVYSLPFLRNT